MPKAIMPYTIPLHFSPEDCNPGALWTEAGLGVFPKQFDQLGRWLETT